MVHGNIPVNVTNKVVYKKYSKKMVKPFDSMSVLKYSSHLFSSWKTKNED